MFKDYSPLPVGQGLLYLRTFILSMRLISFVYFASLISQASLVRAADIDMVRFGAVGDGKTNNTEIIQTAIDACSNAGGGEVFFPPGILYDGICIHQG